MPIRSDLGLGKEKKKDFQLIMILNDVDSLLILKRVNQSFPVLISLNI